MFDPDRNASRRYSNWYPESRHRRRQYSAADLFVDLVPVAKGHCIFRNVEKTELLEAAFNLDGVVRKPPIRRITAERGGIIEFEDGCTVKNFDKVIFGTGYRLSYPFLTPGPITSQNRLAGFYQHIFKIGDPTLVVVGQVFLKFPP